jgi:hypothetical protein
VRSNAYARVKMVTRGHITGRLQRRLSRVARHGASRSHPCYRSAQVVRELCWIYSLLLNVLPDSTEDGWSNGANDLVRVIATHARDVAHALRHSIMVLAEHLRKRRRLLWILRLCRGFAVEVVGITRVRAGRNGSSYKGDRRIHRLLRYHRIDAKPLTYLMYGRAGDLLLNLLLN